MKSQIILITTLAAVVFVVDIDPLKAQPLAPVATPANVALEQVRQVNNNQNVNQPDSRNSKFVAAAGVPQVANLPVARGTTSPQAAIQNTVADNVYEPTTVLATVGPEYILAGDLIPQVEFVLLQ